MESQGPHGMQNLPVAKQLRGLSSSSHANPPFKKVISEERMAPLRQAAPPDWALMEAVRYYYEFLTPAWPTDIVAKEPATFHKLGTMTPFFIGRMIEYRFLTACKQKDKLMRPDIDPSSAVLWQKLLEFVLFQIRTLNSKFSGARPKTANAILYGFFTLIISVNSLDMSISRAHLKGAFAYINYMGGFDVVSKFPYREYSFCWLVRLVIVSNTTCPAGHQELSCENYPEDGLKKVLAWDLNPSLPVPLELMMALVRINRLRYQVATGQALDQPLIDSVREIFANINHCNLEIFSAIGNIVTTELSYPIAKIFQCAVQLFGILTLPRHAVLLFFSAALEDKDPDAYTELRNSHRRRLIGLSRQILPALRYTPAIYWPMVVAGVAAATEEAGEQDQKYIAKLLYEAWKNHLTPLQKLRMLEKLQCFWQSGETDWDACFRDPILCW
ncbi:hypothetical protein NLG97_g973 [Lecanicillium saksenae]|uniref:Uncharacterized protein n=1 Tax=Lecanicillium saksenae TaxID=468837 RepID=A0ACC1R510_9HYPO|nr:hypothetical protein NLG97_g973 [Lecanicillium saksenae]